MSHEDHHVIINFLESTRKSVVHLLGPDQANQPTAADFSLGLLTLKTSTDTAWRLAEKDRLVAEKEKIKAHTEQLRAEIERIKAQKM